MKAEIDYVKSVIDETLDHLIVECSAYDLARDIAISKYKGI